jgi:hypothetical protein
MKQPSHEFNEQIQNLLEPLRQVHPLDPSTVAEERKKFLAQGAVLQQAVSSQGETRQIKWNSFLIQFLQKKEHKRMLTTVMSILIAIVILFGGGGATALAAQDSLPGDLLYPVKIWSENNQLTLASTNQHRLELTLGFSNQRVVEMTRLQAAGKDIPESAGLRLQEHLDSALSIAAEMEDPQMLQALAAIRLQAENQSRQVENLQKGIRRDSEPILKRLRDRLRDQLALCTTGTTDPQLFRLQVRERQQIRQQEGTPTQNPGITPEPANNRRGQGQPTGTPASSAPGAKPTQTPGSQGGYGPGPGQPSSTPGSYGPGSPTKTATCTPVQDGTGPGPGPKPTQTAQPGGPGPNPSNPTATPHSGGTGGGEPTQTPNKGGGKP